jgi:hypothetical protein
MKEVPHFFIFNFLGCLFILQNFIFLKIYLKFCSFFETWAEFLEFYWSEYCEWLKKSRPVRKRSADPKFVFANLHICPSFNIGPLYCLCISLNICFAVWSFCKIRWARMLCKFQKCKYTKLIVKMNPTVLPRGRNFGRKAQKGPKKDWWGRESQGLNFCLICQKRAEKGPNFIQVWFIIKSSIFPVPPTIPINWFT